MNTLNPWKIIPLALLFTFAGAPRASANPAILEGAAAAAAVLEQLHKAFDDADHILRGTGALLRDGNNAICQFVGRPDSTQVVLNLDKKITDVTLPVVQQLPCGQAVKEQAQDLADIANDLIAKTRATLAANIACRADVVRYQGAIAQVRVSLVTLKIAASGRTQCSSTSTDTDSSTDTRK